MRAQYERAMQAASEHLEEVRRTLEEDARKEYARLSSLEHAHLGTLEEFIERYREAMCYLLSSLSYEVSYVVNKRAV